MREPRDPGARGAPGPPKTRVSDEAARQSALDAWLASSERELVAVAQAYEQDPEAAARHVRPFLEAWAASVRLAIDPQFKPYDGRELHKPPLSEALGHLPVDRQELARLAKNLGDLFAHNQGPAQTTSSRVMLGVLAHLVEMAEWQWTEAVMRPMPEALQAIAMALDRARREAAPRATRGSCWVVAAVGSAVAAALAVAATMVAMRNRPGIEADPSVRDTKLAARPPQPGAAGPVPLPALGVTHPWLDRLGAELTVGDVDRIAALYRYPLRWYFAKPNASEDDVKRLARQWYGRRQGQHHLHLFEGCHEAPAPNGERAFQCTLRLAPELPGLGPSDTCLVFDADGLVISRTESSKIPGCPPSQ